MYTRDVLTKHSDKLKIDLASVLEVRVDKSSCDATGKVLGAFVKIEGILVQATWERLRGIGQIYGHLVPLKLPTKPARKEEGICDDQTASSTMTASLSDLKPQSSHAFVRFDFADINSSSGHVFHLPSLLCSKKFKPSKVFPL